MIFETYLVRSQIDQQNTALNLNDKKIGLYEYLCSKDFSLLDCSVLIQMCSGCHGFEKFIVCTILCCWFTCFGLDSF